jgi:hypothetical protein
VKMTSGMALPLVKARRDEVRSPMEPERSVQRA